MEIKHLAPEELCDRFKSKRDLYDLHEVDMGYYLPSFSKTQVEFLRCILAGKKKVLKNSQVKSVIVPKYKELGLKKMWAYIKEVEDLSIYFPDYTDKQLPEREYMWSVVATLRENAAHSIIETARESRSLLNKDNQDDLIEVTEQFMEELNKVTKKKTHKGVTTFLLRKSAILKKARKDPNKYEAEYSLLDRPDDYYDEMAPQKDLNFRRGYHNTIEMDEEEESKSS